ncbi:MAG: energy transducer TonB [Alphaproteobacteria bacterium]
MIARLGGSIVLAGLITLSLFFVMQLLIAGEDLVLEEQRNFGNIDITMEEEDQDPRRKQRTKPEREEVPPPPPPKLANVQLNQNQDLGGVQMEFDTAVNTDIAFGGVNAAALDRGAYPKFRVTPQFPRRAQERGISGCVIFGFTITKTGGTSDIYVIDSSSSMFERNGTRAIEQFKYEPLIINGQPAATPNQTIRLVWALEGERLPDHPACAE